jgi:peptidoglycan/xylan/chitin deacetylase (PgdA/CDA1 family)
MINQNYPRIYFVGAAALVLAAVLCLAGPAYAVIPMALFVILCLAAPFFPGWQLFLPSVMQGDKGMNGVALTFDDGPAPETTPAILEMLNRHGIKATFFVIGEKAALYPELIKNIVDDGHAIGNHTMSHDVFIMLKSQAILEKEIAGCQEILAGFGIKSLIFRPPAGIVNPRLGPILSRLGLFCVMFSRRGKDFGNRRVDKISRNILKGIKAGDIIMLHDRAPAKDIPVSELIRQIKETITGIRKKGLAFLPLEKIIGRKVMEGLWQRQK